MTRKLEKLREVWAIADYTERRKQLRAMAMSRLSHLMTRSDAIALAKGSPLVGDGPDQVKMRPVISGVRDLLDVPTMVALVMDQVNYTDLHRAIMSPSSYALPTPEGSKSKLPYVFGRPIWLDDESHDRNISELTTTTKESHMGLTTLTNVFDALTIEGHDKDEVLAAMKAMLKPELYSGLSALLTVRDPNEVPFERPALDSEGRAIYSDVLHALESEEEEGPEVEAMPSKYVVPGEAQAKLLDLMLEQSGLPAIAAIVGELNDATRKIAEAKATAGAVYTEVECKASGEMPKGKVGVMKASEAFGLTRAKDTFDFDVPVWEWDGEHPHVPEVDEGYVFRPFELFRVLYALLTNQRAYLHGHTGTGKTTLIEQVAARLKWPFMRINFDSEITRMDLIGRDVLTNDGGVTTSKFVDGILPQMMSGPYIGCFDEIDFVRPDVAYVMQRALEGNGLLLTEDAGRLVKPHRMFRMFATGNTVGQGDEYGMYQGARPQSLALLDRFTVWVHIDYMNAVDRKKLIKARVSGLAEDMVVKLDKYIGEHLEAFKTSKVMQPISPRGYLALGNALAYYSAIFPETKGKTALEQAIEATVLDRASAQDRAVLKGIVDRVFA